MSSNAPHPVAGLPVFDLDLTTDPESAGGRGLQATIYGRFVAIKVGSSAFLIYDWVTCSKIMVLNRPNYTGDSHSCFLSVDYLLVVSCLTGLEDSESRGVPSGLSIYCLDDSGKNKTNPQPIARFFLPDHNFQPVSNPSDTNIHTFISLSSPLTREVPPTYWQTPLSGRPAPKVFELAHDNYVLRLDINGRPESHGSFYSGMLYINSRGLLGALVQAPGTETASITWEMWRHCTTWRETGHTKDFAISEDLCAQRALSLRREKHPFRYALYEFNRATDNDNPELSKMSLNRAFSDATRSFTRKVVNDDAFTHVRYSCFMDDEHIVFAKAERAASDVE